MTLWGWVRLRLYLLACDIRGTQHKVWIWFIWHLPAKVVYWAIIRACTASAFSNINPLTVTAKQMLDHWQYWEDSKIVIEG